MQLLRTFVTYGRFRAHHPDWPYVLGDVLAVCLLVGALLFLGGCQPKEEPVPPTVPAPEDLSTWTVPELVQPAAPVPAPPKAVKLPAGPSEKVVDYKPGVAVEVPVSLGFPLDIVLEPGEQVRNIVDGDRAPAEQSQGQARRWEVREGSEGHGPDLRQHVFVTVTEPGLTNGLTITTTRRTYYVTCKSIAKSPVRVLRWHYPPDGRDGLPLPPGVEFPPLLPPPEEARHYHIGYTMTVSQPPPPWVPRHVVDDGKKLYVVYPEITLFETVPMVRMVGPQGPQMVNSRQHLNVVIIDQLAARLELRVGLGEQAEVVTITRERLRTIRCPGHDACPVWPAAAAALAGRRS